MNSRAAAEAESAGDFDAALVAATALVNDEPTNEAHHRPSPSRSWRVCR
jgi:hypothetical protein